jgi:acetyl-CoA C-acetyltransferase
VIGMADAASDAVVIGAARTAIGDAYKGSLANVSINDLGHVVVEEAMARAGVQPDQVDDLVLGEVLHGGGDIARHLAVSMGLTEVPGLAVQRQCATGMSAVTVAAAEITAGMNRVAIAGGIASMTQSPTTFMASPYPWAGMERWLSPSHPDRPDAPNMNMMVTVGENTARAVGVTREEMDDWSLGSHRKAVAAIDDGRFVEEIVPVKAPGWGGGANLFEVDEHPRRETSAEKLAALRVLSGVPDGTITAGNSSSINDGAAALVLARREVAEANGSTVLATIRGWAAVGVDPAETGLAPTKAIPKAVERAGMALSDVDLYEINEAFASMTVGTIKVLGLDPETVNVNGGAVALGHPVACSGARILVTLIHELRRRGGGVGVASLCAGGGMGMATVVEVAPT